MRNAILLLLTCALPSEFLAQQTVAVAPQALADWTVVGANPQILASQPKLLLPAGAQVASTFDSTDVAIIVTTSPVLGPNAVDFPMLEIGPHTLVFARADTVGILVLVIRDHAQVNLPFSFALDADGRSTEPLTVGFSRWGDTVSVEMSGQTLSFPADPLSVSALEVAASAGASRAWDFENFEVTVGNTDGQAAVASEPSSPIADQPALLAESPPDAGPSAPAGVRAPASGPADQLTASAAGPDDSWVTSVPALTGGSILGWQSNTRQTADFAGWHRLNGFNFESFAGQRIQPDGSSDDATASSFVPAFSFDHLALLFPPAF